MNLLTLINLLGAVNLAHGAPSTDMWSSGILPQNGIDMVAQSSSVLAGSTTQWKVGDPCNEGGVSVSDLSPSIHCADRHSLVSRDLRNGRSRRLL